jgi:hypothetical protein
MKVTKDTWHFAATDHSGNVHYVRVNQGEDVGLTNTKEISLSLSNISRDAPKLRLGLLRCTTRLQCIPILNTEASHKTPWRVV